MPNEIMNFRDVNPDYAVTIEADQVIQLTAKDVLRWIEPNAPLQDAFRFLLTCRSARLNPFLGEAFLVLMKDKYATVISKAGYLKRALQNPDYDGHECGIIIQQFDPRTKAQGEIRDVTGTVMPPGWILIGGWAKVYRKGVGRPFHIRLSMNEYNKGTATWKTLSCTMIRKTALVHAIREAFAIGDNYDQSEVETALPPNRQPLPQDPSAHVVTDRDYEDAEDAALPPDLMGRLRDLIAAAGLTDDQVSSALRRRGVSALGELSATAAQEFIQKLEPLARPAADAVLENIQSPAGGQDQESTPPARGPEPASGPPQVPAAGDPIDDFVIPDAPRRGIPAPAEKTK
jgi:phage recombination protein Bet